MKTAPKSATTAIFTAAATALLTVAQALGYHVTSSTGKTATVSGIVAVLSTLFHIVTVQVAKAKPTTLTMYDTITPADIPPQAVAVAGYVNGKWPTYGSLSSMFPHAKRLSIAVTADVDADCLDVETGDARPEETAGWVIRQHKRGVKRPWVYCNLSTLPAVQANLKTAGIARNSYLIWTADPTNKKHITSGADATQWGWRALGRNLDVSEVKVSAFE